MVQHSETTNNLSDLLSVCPWIQPSRIPCCMIYFLLLNSEYCFACLLTSIRQFVVHCDLLHLWSAASLIQNRAGSLGVRIGIYSNGRLLVMVHCNAPPPPSGQDCTFTVSNTTLCMVMTKCVFYWRHRASSFDIRKPNFPKRLRSSYLLSL